MMSAICYFFQSNIMPGFIVRLQYKAQLCPYNEDMQNLEFDKMHIHSGFYDKVLIDSRNLRCSMEIVKSSQ